MSILVLVRGMIVGLTMIVGYSSGMTVGYEWDDCGISEWDTSGMIVGFLMLLFVMAEPQ